MNRAAAIKKIKELLKTFKYIYKEEQTRINELHLTYKMDSNIFELQSSFLFGEHWVDILTFISPRIERLCYDNRQYIEMLKTINYINWSSKSSCGRMYIDDDFGDIAISLRFTYVWLEKYPEIVIGEYESVIEYYEDLFTLVIEVASGKRDYCEAKAFINEMWDFE